MLSVRARSEDLRKPKQRLIVLLICSNTILVSVVCCLLFVCSVSALSQATRGWRSFVHVISPIKHTYKALRCVSPLRNCEPLLPLHCWSVVCVRAHNCLFQQNPYRRCPRIRLEFISNNLWNHLSWLLLAAHNRASRLTRTGPDLVSTCSTHGCLQPVHRELDGSYTRLSHFHNRTTLASAGCVPAHTQ